MKPLPIDYIQFAQSGGDYRTLPEELRLDALLTLARCVKENTNIMSVKAQAKINEIEEERKVAQDRADYWFQQFSARHSDKEIELGEKIKELERGRAEDRERIAILELELDQIKHPDKYLPEEDIF